MSSNHHLFAEARYRNWSRLLTAVTTRGRPPACSGPISTPNRRQAASIPARATAMLIAMRMPSMPPISNAASCWPRSSWPCS